MIYQWIFSEWPAARETFSRLHVNEADDTYFKCYQREVSVVSSQIFTCFKVNLHLLLCVEVWTAIGTWTHTHTHTNTHTAVQYYLLWHTDVSARILDCISLSLFSIIWALYLFPQIHGHGWNPLSPELSADLYLPFSSLRSFLCCCEGASKTSCCLLNKGERLSNTCKTQVTREGYRGLSLLLQGQGISDKWSNQAGWWTQLKLWNDKQQKATNFLPECSTY